MTKVYRKAILLSSDAEQFRKTVLSQANREDYILFDHAQNTDSPFQWLIGWGKADTFIRSAKDPGLFSSLDQWLARHEDWRMGYLSYDLKNVIEPELESFNRDEIQADLVHLFVPEVVFLARNNQVTAYLLEGTTLPEFTSRSEVLQPESARFTPVLSRETYRHKISTLKDHILRGDVYEINFCSEWKSGDPIENPAQLYAQLYQKLQAPFSGYFQLGDIQLLCCSPERFLKKEGDRLISQPIKGTAPRNKDPEIDQLNKAALLTDKEKAENVMIVDLVRNDFSRIARKGTVSVEELFGTYTFNQVHQLISTVSCELDPAIRFSDILKATFPMGSMTGAPKISAMKLSETYEPMKRGLYSGSIGYFTPDGGFDFNVVIRSILHNAALNKTVIRAGSAITYASDPDQEWQECQWKITSLLEVFN